MQAVLKMLSACPYALSFRSSAAICATESAITAVRNWMRLLLRIRQVFARSGSILNKIDVNQNSKGIFSKSSFDSSSHLFRSGTILNG